MSANSGTYTAASSTGGAGFSFSPNLKAQTATNTNIAFPYDPGNQQRGIPVGLMFAYISDQTDVVNQKLANLKSAGSSLSITDMFELQMKMNRLSQVSEMATAVVSAASGSITSIARNVKS